MSGLLRRSYPLLPQRKLILIRLGPCLVSRSWRYYLWLLL